MAVYGGALYSGLPDNAGHKEIYCFTRSRISFLRVAVDLPVILFVVAYNSFEGFTARWNDAYDTLWLHTRLAIVLMELCIIPPSFQKGDVCIERLHLYAYRGLAFVIMLCDVMMVYLTSRDVHNFGAKDDFLMRLLIVLSLHVINWWRCLEITVNVTMSVVKTFDVENTVHQVAAAPRQKDTAPLLVRSAENQRPVAKSTVAPMYPPTRTLPAAPPLPPPPSQSSLEQHAVSVLGRFSTSSDGCTTCATTGCSTCGKCSRSLTRTGKVHCRGNSRNRGWRQWDGV